MPRESNQHIELVKHLVHYIRKTHEPPGGFVLYSDVGGGVEDLPQMVNGYIPDVFASDVPSTFQVIGEAKTPKDLNSYRSKKQIKAFLDFLSLFPDSFFYLAIPTFSLPNARRLLNEITTDNHANIEIKALPFEVGVNLC